MKIKTSAPGKLILLGEYAVLEGAPALVMAVNRFAVVTIQTTSSSQPILNAPAIGITDLPFTLDVEGSVVFSNPISQQMRQKLVFFTTALETLSAKGNPVHFPSLSITLDTSQFFTGEGRKLGLGSSAALTVALCSALSRYRDPDFDIEKNSDFIFTTSLQIHRKAQDNVGSGIDIAASVFGGTVKYQIAGNDPKTLPVCQKLTIPDDLHILSVWSGESASTAQFVRKVNRFKMRRSSEFEAIIARMKEASLTGIEAIQQKDVKQFMKAVQLYYDEMKALGEKSGVPIVSSTHQRIHELVRGQGGAYKPSGAGGGDIGIAFCDSTVMKERIIRKLSENGFQIINLEFVEKGVQVKTL